MEFTVFHAIFHVEHARVIGRKAPVSAPVQWGFMASSATNDVMRQVSITGVNVKVETVYQTALSASMATFVP